jgi:hypothetical protein
MSKLETPLTLAYWNERGNEGTLHEELTIVKGQRNVQGQRKIDAAIFLDDPPGGRKQHGTRDFSGQNMVIIQTKATPLNSYVFGQALLSPRLIALKQEGSGPPGEIESLILCTADHPEMRSIIARHHADLKILVREGPVRNFCLDRIPDAAEEYAESKGERIVTAACLIKGLTIDGVIIPDLSPGDERQPLCKHLVAGRKVISVHSEQDSQGNHRRMGMWMGGEVRMSQILLKEMGASDVHSVVLCGGSDRAIDEVLSPCTSFEVRKRNRDTGRWEKDDPCKL